MAWGFYVSAFATYDVAMRISASAYREIAVDDFIQAGLQTLPTEAGLDDDDLQPSDRILIRRGDAWKVLNLQDFLTSIVFQIPAP